MELLHTLGIEPQVVVVNIISFLLLVWLLGKVMVGPLSTVLRERKDEIESSYRRIAGETSKLQTAQADLERRLAEIEAEARGKIEEAGAQGARLKDEILAEARAQAERVRERGLQDIERERDKALQSIREHVADLVVQAGGKILGESLNDAKHRELIDKTLSDLGTMRN